MSPQNINSRYCNYDNLGRGGLDKSGHLEFDDNHSVQKIGWNIHICNKTNEFGHFVYLLVNRRRRDEPEVISHRQNGCFCSFYLLIVVWRSCFSRRRRCVSSFMINFQFLNISAAASDVLWLLITNVSLSCFSWRGVVIIRVKENTQPRFRLGSSYPARVRQQRVNWQGLVYTCISIFSPEAFFILTYSSTTSFAKLHVPLWLPGWRDTCLKHLFWSLRLVIRSLRLEMRC